MAKTKAPQQKEFKGMPEGDTPKEVREVAEKFVSESLALAKDKAAVATLKDRLMTVMSREKTTVAVVIVHPRKYYITIDKPAAKIKIEVGPVVPSASSNGKE